MPDNAQPSLDFSIDRLRESTSRLDERVKMLSTTIDRFDQSFANITTSLNAVVQRVMLLESESKATQVVHGIVQVNRERIGKLESDVSLIQMRVGKYDQGAAKVWGVVTQVVQGLILAYLAYRFGFQQP